MIKDTSPSGQNRERPSESETYAGNVRDFLLRIKKLGTDVKIIKIKDIPTCLIGQEITVAPETLTLLAQIYHEFGFPMKTQEGECVRYSLNTLQYGFSGILGTDQKEANYIFGSNHAIAYLQTESGIAAVDWTLCYIFSRVNCGIELAVFTASTLTELSQLITQIYGGRWAELTPEYIHYTAEICRLEDGAKKGELDHRWAEQQATELLDKRSAFPKYKEDND